MAGLKSLWTTYPFNVIAIRLLGTVLSNFEFETHTYVGDKDRESL